jgi:hypothetical protein
MTTQPSRIDQDSLAALALHWMARTYTAHQSAVLPGYEPLTAGGYAAQFSGFEMNEHSAAICTDTALADGFNFGLAVAAAVMSDPLGDPTRAIQAVVESVRETFDEYRADHENFGNPEAA